MKISMTMTQTFIQQVQSGTLPVREQLQRLRLFLRHNGHWMNGPTKNAVRSKIKHLRNYCVRVRQRSR